MRDNYNLFPKRQILPYDGMSINAVVWNEAHQYHERLLSSHQYFLHGTGIVTGLEVIGSDPPDSVVYILPGVAVDTAGKMVVLAEPVAYDLGEKIVGELRLLLLHREVKATVEREEGSNPPAYKQSEFVIVARTEELDAPHVELARIQRDSAKAKILDAEDPNKPGVNEIDLRFRAMVSTPVTTQVLAGVCYLDDVPDKFYDQAMVNLGKALAGTSSYQLIVENDVPLDDGIFKYDLLYFVGTSEAKLTKKPAELLGTFVENGGKILVEFCEKVEDNVVTGLIKPTKIKLGFLGPDDDLFRSPNLFVFPPQGAVSQEEVKLWYGDPGLICSNAGYGAVWSGKVQDPMFTRAFIRDAIEWGVNMLHVLLSE